MREGVDPARLRPGPLQQAGRHELVERRETLSLPDTRDPRERAEPEAAPQHGPGRQDVHRRGRKRTQLVPDQLAQPRRDETAKFRLVEPLLRKNDLPPPVLAGALGQHPPLQEDTQDLGQKQRVPIGLVPEPAAEALELRDHPDVIEMYRSSEDPQEDVDVPFVYGVQRKTPNWKLPSEG